MHDLVSHGFCLKTPYWVHVADPWTLNSNSRLREASLTPVLSPGGMSHPSVLRTQAALQHWVWGPFEQRNHQQNAQKWEKHGPNYTQKAFLWTRKAETRRQAVALRDLSWERAQDASHCPLLCVSTRHGWHQSTTDTAPGTARQVSEQTSLHAQHPQVTRTFSHSRRLRSVWGLNE